MKVVVSGTAYEDFKELEEDFDKIFNYGLFKSAEDYATYVKNRYLSGQAMKYRTGELYKSVKYLKDSKSTNSYIVMAGVGVTGHLNYLNRYVGTDKEFIRPAFENWESQKRAFKIVEANFNKVAKFKGLT